MIIWIDRSTWSVSRRRISTFLHWHQAPITAVGSSVAAEAADAEAEADRETKPSKTAVLLVVLHACFDQRCDRLHSIQQQYTAVYMYFHMIHIYHA